MTKPTPPASFTAPMQLIQRDIDILSLLISEYVATAAPVGSTTIASRGNLGLSSATIRNVLARLEDVGLLTHPHTSAGRLPTTPGLRYYVNTILSRHDLSEEEKNSIQRQFGSASPDVEDVLKRAGKILSLVSNYTGLVVMPKSDQITFKHIEFLPLSPGKVMGIFVSREGQVHNRIIDVGEDFTYPDFEKISNYCDKSFYGCTLSEAIAKAAKSYEEERAKYDLLISKALVWSKELLTDASREELVIHGESKFLSEPEFADIEKLKHVMAALEEKKEIVHLLNRAVESDEVCVFIGTESNYKAVTDCSIVTTPYKKHGQVVGTIGIIGPTRMNYSKVIPTVDFMAKIVSGMLEV